MSCFPILLSSRTVRDKWWKRFNGKTPTARGQLNGTLLWLQSQLSSEAIAKEKPSQKRKKTIARLNHSACSLHPRVGWTGRKNILRENENLDGNDQGFAQASSAKRAVMLEGKSYCQSVNSRIKLSKSKTWTNAILSRKAKTVTRWKTELFVIKEQPNWRKSEWLIRQKLKSPWKSCRLPFGIKSRFEKASNLILASAKGW